MDLDEQCLREALREADRRRGFCSPNPAVGAVVAKDGKILDRGHHRAAGEPHAEVEALSRLGDEARGATIYVTLEPCCHHGRTPPCTGLLVERKLGRVVFAYRDPNPKVDGGGRRALEAAGIAVEHRPLADVDAFYRSYAHWTRTGLPFVTAKLALSLDGKIAAAGGKTVRLTGPEADSRTHEARRRADAILTTARTVLADDPRLDARTGDGAFPKTVYVLDRRGELPPTARVHATARKVVVLGSELGRDLATAMAAIGRDGVHDLWVEAGGRLFDALLSSPFLQRGVLYVAPRSLGPEAVPAFPRHRDFSADFQEIRWEWAGRDAVLTLER